MKDTDPWKLAAQLAVQGPQGKHQGGLEAEG